MSATYSGRPPVGARAPPWSECSVTMWGEKKESAAPDEKRESSRWYLARGILFKEGFVSRVWLEVVLFEENVLVGWLCFRVERRLGTGGRG